LNFTYSKKAFVKRERETDRLYWCPWPAEVTTYENYVQVFTKTPLRGNLE
jgi:hypothetical protein